MSYHEQMARIVAENPGQPGIFIVYKFLDELGYTKNRKRIRFGFAVVKAAKEADLIRAEGRLLYPGGQGESGLVDDRGDG